MAYVIGVDVFQRLGLAVVTRSGQKKRGQYGGTGVQGLGGDGRRMSVPRQRLGRVNEEGYASG